MAEKSVKMRISLDVLLTLESFTVINQQTFQKLPLALALSEEATILLKLTRMKTGFYILLYILEAAMLE